MVAYTQIILLSCSVLFLLLSFCLMRQPLTHRAWKELQERGLKESRMPLLMAALSGFTLLLGGAGAFFA